MRLAELRCLDVSFCTGLFYRLPEPWRLIQQFAPVRIGVFLWTHCSAEALSGLFPDPFSPTLGSLASMYTQNGFPEVRLIGNDSNQVNGPAVTLAASA